MKKKLKECGIIVLTIFVAIVVLYISDIGCVVRYMTGIPCPGCGMSRACVSLLMLDFEKAFRYHPMVYALPIFVIAYLWARRKGKRGSTVLWIGGICFVVTYLARVLVLKDPVLEIDIMSGRIWRTVRLFIL